MPNLIFHNHLDPLTTGRAPRILTSWPIDYSAPNILKEHGLKRFSKTNSTYPWQRVPLKSRPFGSSALESDLVTLFLVITLRAV